MTTPTTSAAPSGTVRADVRHPGPRCPKCGFHMHRCAQGFSGKKFIFWKCDHDWCDGETDLQEECAICHGRGFVRPSYLDHTVDCECMLPNAPRERAAAADATLQADVGREDRTC